MIILSGFRDFCESVTMLALGYWVCVGDTVFYPVMGLTDYTGWLIRVVIGVSWEWILGVGSDVVIV